MPKQIYNAGRVVGMSNYEIYAKHALEENPGIDIPSEREWLASQLVHGTSMILKIKAHDTSGIHYVDYPLPEDSKLCSANVLVASQFFGVCAVDSIGWATKVTDYGQGISNTSNKYPLDNVDASEYPTQTIREFNDAEKKQILNYIKIQDGVSLQPGAWRSTEHGSPAKDFTADLTNIPVIRITFASKITSDFYIVITGFTNRGIIAGITKLETGSTEEEGSENGDFLGPALYPWANKIIFTQSPITTYFIRKYFRSTYYNLRIDHADDSIETLFTASYLKPSPGISIVGPTTPGGNITIGSGLSSEGTAKNYIKVDQTTSTTEHINTTTLTPSEITAGYGVAYHKPSTPAEAVNFSSMVGTANNYLKVLQVKSKSNISNSYVNAEKSNNLISESDLSANTNGYTTLLQASPLVIGGTELKYTPPSTPGGDMTLSYTLATNNANYLSLSRNNGTTTLNPATMVEGNSTGSRQTKYVKITPPSSSNHTVTFYLDYDQLRNDITDDFNISNGNKYLKITKNTTNHSITFQPSTLVEKASPGTSNKKYIKIEQPTTDGGDVNVYLDYATLANDLSVGITDDILNQVAITVDSSRKTYMKVDKTAAGKFTILPLKIGVMQSTLDDGTKFSPLTLNAPSSDPEAGDYYTALIGLRYGTLRQYLRQDMVTYLLQHEEFKKQIHKPLVEGIRAILAKIGNGTSQFDIQYRDNPISVYGDGSDVASNVYKGYITWQGLAAGNDTRIPAGTMNIYSYKSTGSQVSIRTHQNVSDGDVKCQ